MSTNVPEWAVRAAKEAATVYLDHGFPESVEGIAAIIAKHAPQDESMLYARNKWSMLCGHFGLQHEKTCVADITDKVGELVEAAREVSECVFECSFEQSDRLRRALKPFSNPVSEPTSEVQK